MADQTTVVASFGYTVLSSVSQLNVFATKREKRERKTGDTY